MVKGIVFALAACFVWGLTFVIPEFESSFTPIEIALGRYFMFGLLSLLIFSVSWRRGMLRYPFAIWKKALLFALASNIGCYTLLVLGVRYSSAEISALIVGIAPVTIAFYGNWKRKEGRFRELILPSMLIITGLLSINGFPFSEGGVVWTYALGMLCCCGTLVAWSWFVVVNATFVKEHPEVSASDWTTLMGVSTLIWVMVLTVAIALFFHSHINFEKYLYLNDALIGFIVGCVVLGLVCSGLGAWFWNRASYHLPVSLAGQLTVFQVIFGLLFAYSVDRRLPPLTESVGILLFLAAVCYDLRSLFPNVSISRRAQRRFGAP